MTPSGAQASKLSAIIWPFFPEADLYRRLCQFNLTPASSRASISALESHVLHGSVCPTSFGSQEGLFGKVAFVLS